MSIEFQVKKEDIRVRVREVKRHVSWRVLVIGFISLLLMVGFTIAKIETDVWFFSVASALSTMGTIFGFLTPFMVEEQLKSVHMKNFEQDACDGVARYLLEEKEDKILCSSLFSGRRFTIIKNEIKSMVYLKRNILLIMKTRQQYVFLKTPETEAFFRTIQDATV